MRKELDGLGQRCEPADMTDTIRYRFGDVREDGMVFKCYHPRCKSGEYWVTPEQFAATKHVAALRRQRIKETRPKKEKRMTIYTHPLLRSRPYRERPFRQKRELTQKEFDTLPYGPHTAPAMTTTENITIIPNFSKYGITPDGIVYRIAPASRGRTAGQRHRVTPVIHPKGHQWCVQITGDDNVRKRIPIKKLMEQVFGKAE